MGGNYLALFLVSRIWIIQHVQQPCFEGTILFFVEQRIVIYGKLGLAEKIMQRLFACKFERRFAECLLRIAIQPLVEKVLRGNVQELKPQQHLFFMNLHGDDLYANTNDAPSPKTPAANNREQHLE